MTNFKRKSAWTPEEQVLRLHHKDPATGCWIFLGDLNQGYGQVTAFTEAGRQTTLRAHRVMYEHLVGPIPEGHQLHHKCRNKRCVNPDHLESLTDLAHKRADAAWVGNRTHCKRGHPLSGDNITIVRGSRRCKACNVIRSQKYRSQNPEKARAQARIDRQRWYERVKEDPAQRQALRDQQRAYMRDWRARRKRSDQDSS